MITVNGLVKRYGDQVLFEDVNLRFDPGKRYGIVGANGTGKTTLLRILTGAESPDGGDLNIPAKLRLGTLNQDHFAFEQVPVMDVVMKGKPALAEALAEKEAVLEDETAPPERIAHLEEIIADHDGYVAEARIGEMLEGLGIPVEKHRRPMHELSGGYKLRVLLAQCLFGEPDVILLDEPTNHLDIYSIKWLESYLCRYRGIVVVVSHDRQFLNNVCTHIMDIDYRSIKEYKGNYDQFLSAKEADVGMRLQEAEKAEKKIADLQLFVNRFKAKASKARQAQSKVKQIERMEREIEDPVYSSRVYPNFAFKSVRPPGKQVLEVRDLAKSFGPKRVLHDVSFDIYRGDKVAVLGPNGIGKSTLVKILVGELEADRGKVEWGYETHPQYFSQDHREHIPGNTSPYEWLYQWAPGESIGVIRGTLGNVLFSGDDVHKSTAALSGGEAARLVLAKLMLLQGNVMLLDEPTNHLDMEAIEALVQALQAFDGTVVLVSHNRYVVDHVATKILDLSPDGFEMFDGTFREFLEKVGVDHLSYQVDLRAEKPVRENPVRKPAKERDKKEKGPNLHGYKTEAKPLLERNKAFESEIEKLEAQVEEINELFFDPGFFSRTPPDEVRAKNEAKKALETELEERYRSWEELNLEIERLKRKYGVE